MKLTILEKRRNEAVGERHTLWSSVTMPTAFGMIIAVFFLVMLVMLDTKIFIYNQTLTSTVIHCTPVQ